MNGIKPATIAFSKPIIDPRYKIPIENIIIDDKQLVGIVEGQSESSKRFIHNSTNSVLERMEWYRTTKKNRCSCTFKSKITQWNICQVRISRKLLRTCFSCTPSTLFWNVGNSKSKWRKDQCAYAFTFAWI